MPASRGETDELPLGHRSITLAFGGGAERNDNRAVRL